MAVASKMVERAVEAAKKKNFDYAVELYLEHLKVNPGDVDARKALRMVERERYKVNPPGMFERAKIQTRIAGSRSMPVSKKDPEKSILNCEEILRADPSSVHVLLKLGEAASYANLNDVAIYTFEDALTVEPKNVEVLRFLGRVYRATEGLDKAYACFERLLKVSPQDQEAQNMVRDIPAQMTQRKMTGTDGKTKGYQDLIDKDASKKLEDLSARVRTPEQAKERIDTKLAEIEKAGGKADNKTWRIMAEWAIIGKDYEQAIGFYDKALVENPKDYSSLEGKGDVKLKKYANTIKKLENALEKSPDDATFKAKLEKVKKEMQAFTIEEYTTRVEAHPTEYGLRLELGRALYDTDQVDEAIKQLQAAKQSSQCKAEAGLILGRAFGMKKKIYNLAVKELEAARQDLVEMEGIKKEICYLLGRLHEAAKKPDKALTEYSSIAEVDYNFKDVTTRMEKLGSA